ncbi:MAG: nitroreductase family protein [Candidatus Planktophila sp.]|jgi:nitroreductase|nr:nitroreductase family protein [Candidatus Planktophila sp.]MBP7903167.1 nitroreductase family protein [Candidatus Planktophila sp.]
MRAETSTPVNEIIATRRSPRSFNETAELSDGDLLAMLEAARWAPSAFNGQPWRYFVGKRGSQVFGEILSSLGEFNQMWAKNASALILVASTTVKSDGSIHADYQYDCGLSVAQLTIEAHDRNLIVHQMTGFDREVAKSAVAIGDDLVAVVVVAVGTQDAPEKLAGPLLERELAPRQRLPLETIVVKGLPA